MTIVSRLLLLYVLSVISVSNIKAETELHSTYIGWQKGDVFDYTMTKAKESLTPEGFALRGKVESELRVSVVARNDAFFDVDWTLGRTRLIDGPDMHNPSAQAFLNIMQGVTMELVLDKRGALQDLKNYEDIRGIVEGFMDKLVSAQVKAGEIPEENAGQLLEMALAPYQSKEIMIANTLPEISLFFAAHGFELSDGTYLELEGALPNPLGGEPFPASGSVELEHIDEKENTLTVLWKLAPEPTELNRIMLNTFQTITAQRGAPAPSEEELPPMTISDMATYVFEAETGAIINIQHTKLVDLGISGTREATSFVLK